MQYNFIFIYLTCAPFLSNWNKVWLSKDPGHLLTVPLWLQPV